jgi:hypothetical protein
MCRSAGRILLIAICCLAAREGRAQDSGNAAPAGAPSDPKALAQQHVDRGRTASEGGDLLGGLAEFQAAYALVPSPKLLYNMAQVERSLGRPLDALDHYEKFLAETDSDEGDPAFAPKLEKARQAVAALSAQVATLDIAADAGAAILVDDQPRGTAPLAGPLRLSPGPHVVTCRRAGREVRRDVELVAGGRARVEAPFPAPVVAAVALEAPAPLRAPGPLAADLTAKPPVPEQRTGRPFYRRWYFWSAVGAVVVAAGATAWLWPRRPPCDATDARCFNAN